MLKLKHLFLAGLAALSLTPIVARAGEPYAMIGGWAIQRHEPGNCSMFAVYERGTSMFVAYKYNQWHFALFDPSWTALQNGKNYTMSFVLDGVDRWSGTFQARYATNVPGLFLDDVNERFLGSLMRRWEIDVYNGAGNFVTRLRLDNSFVAMTMTAQCSAESGGSNRSYTRQPNGNYTM